MLKILEVVFVILLLVKVVINNKIQRVHTLLLLLKSETNLGFFI